MSTSKHEAATVAATGSEAKPRIEIVAYRRRAHSAAFRAGVVAEAMAPGARVQDVARRHQVCASLIYRWRREAGGAGNTSAVRLFPVRIAASDETPPAATALSRAAATRPAGSIEIELAGDVRIRVDENVSAVALRRVLSVLRR